MVGIYLYGSLISGDFDITVSDIDLVVVLQSALDQRQFRQLQQMHSRVVDDQPQWRDRLELAYISRRALQTFRRATSTIGIISPGEPFHLVEAGDDWLISWYDLRLNGIALQGPPIESLIDAIPEERLAGCCAAAYLRLSTLGPGRCRRSVACVHCSNSRARRLYPGAWSSRLQAEGGGLGAQALSPLVRSHRARLDVARGRGKGRAPPHASTRGS